MNWAIFMKDANYQISKSIYDSFSSIEKNCIGSLVSEIRHKNEIKAIQIGNEEIKLSLFTAYDHLCRKSDEIYTTLPEPKGDFSKIRRYKINMRKT